MTFQVMNEHPTLTKILDMFYLKLMKKNLEIVYNFLAQEFSFLCLCYLVSYFYFRVKNIFHVIFNKLLLLLLISLSILFW